MFPRHALRGFRLVILYNGLYQQSGGGGAVRTGVGRDMHDFVANIRLSDNYLSPVGMIPTCNRSSNGFSPYVLSTPEPSCPVGGESPFSAGSRQLHTAVCSGSMVLLYI